MKLLQSEQSSNAAKFQCVYLQIFYPIFYREGGVHLLLSFRNPSLQKKTNRFSGVARFFFRGEGRRGLCPDDLKLTHFFP